MVRSRSELRKGGRDGLGLNRLHGQGCIVELSKKLQLPKGATIFLKNAPRGLVLELPVSRDDSAAAVLVFATDSGSLKANASPAVEAAKEDRLSWIAYPKGGQLRTDLTRDRLQGLLLPLGIEGVRLISIDDVWSAMRFRPKRTA